MIEASGIVGRQTEPVGTEANRHQERRLRSGNTVAKTCKDYKVQLDERGIRTSELESEAADAAENLRAEMDELRRQGDEQRIGFELQLAGVRNVKAARALLPDHDNDIEKLKAAEPWLFGEGAPAPSQAGATGLPSAGAGGGEKAELKRWREITGLDEK